jgi:hypothetical protein
VQSALEPDHYGSESEEYDDPNESLAQVTAYLAAVVSLVGYYLLGSRLRSAPAWSLDLSLFHEFSRDRLLVPLSRSEQEHHGLPSAFGPQMHLGTEAALATTQRYRNKGRVGLSKPP